MKISNSTDRLSKLSEQLEAIPTIAVLQADASSSSVGVTFEYLGQTYTTYLSATTLKGELLRHNPSNLAEVENVGSINVEELLRFFQTLPAIEEITK